MLAKCWIVERAFAWLGRYRRLSKDDEADPTRSESRIRCAMILLMVGMTRARMTFFTTPGASRECRPCLIPERA